LILSVDNISESWVVDSGASFHATPHRKHFLDYVQGDFGQVHLGDDAPCKIVGMGKVKIKQCNGNQWLLKEVRHVPDLRKNIISTGQLASEGCISIFTDNMWKVIKGSLVIVKGEKVVLAANPFFFFDCSQKASYTPSGIMTNHCRIVLIRHLSRFLRQLQFNFILVFKTTSVKASLSLLRLPSFLVDLLKEYLITGLSSDFQMLYQTYVLKHSLTLIAHLDIFHC
jgi:hypothetical protein